MSSPSYLTFFAVCLTLIGTNHCLCALIIFFIHKCKMCTKYLLFLFLFLYLLWNPVSNYFLYKEREASNNNIKGKIREGSPAGAGEESFSHLPIGPTPYPRKQNKKRRREKGPDKRGNQRLEGILVPSKVG